MAETLEELVSQIKDKLDIVDVVSRQVILKKKGNHYWGLCPFHKEKTPSFSVNPEKGIFKCFGCGEGGDAISFIMKTQNREFMDVIKDLAERFHLEMPQNMKSDGASKGIKEEMIRACTKAAEFYNIRLKNDDSPQTKSVRKYLEERGITEDIVDIYMLGVAPKDFAVFYNKFKDEFTDEVLEKAGLIVKSKDGRYIDRFRNRVIIPIKNEFGDIVAFGARAVEKDQSPKYLNSSDSLIYNKSRLLYGLYHAKDAIKEEDCVVLMEGYFDVISAQAHGIKNAVASCGTSLTQEHIKLLSRYTPSRRIYLSFDTDSAGQKATERNAGLIKEAFEGLGDIKQFDESYLSVNEDKYACEIRVISPPEGKDPDEFIRTVGAESYKEFMKNAPLYLDFQIQNLLKQKDEYKTPIEKTKLISKLAPIIGEIKNEIISSEYIRMIASELDIKEDALQKEFKKMNTAHASQIETPSVNVTKIVKKNVSILEKAQKNLLSVFLVKDCPLKFQEINEIIGDTTFSNETLIIVKSTIDKLICTVNNVKELTEKLYNKFVQTPDLQRLLTELTDIAETFQNLDSEEFTNLIRENISKIEQFNRDKEKENFRMLYKNADDDIEALKIQMQLRDKLKKKYGK
mgnify:CR=1 FL=1